MLRTARDRLEFAFARRELLLRVARQHAPSQADAEDAVAVGVERAADAAARDEGQMWCWLLVVVVNECRQTQRRRPSPRTMSRLAARSGPAEDPADEVCDRAEAAWVAGLVGELSAPQRRAIQLLADGHSIGEAAADMGLTYKATESLLFRARATVRAAVAAVEVAVGVLAGLLRRRGPRTAVAVVPLVVAGVALSVVTQPLEGGPLPPPSEMRRAGSTVTVTASEPAYRGGPPAVLPVVAHGRSPLRRKPSREVGALYPREPGAQPPAWVRVDITHDATGHSLPQEVARYLESGELVPTS